MNKIFASLIAFLLVTSTVVLANTQVPANLVTSTTGTFSKCLTSSDTNVQQSLNDIDTCFGNVSGTPASPVGSFQYNNAGNFAGGNMYESGSNIGIGSTLPGQLLDVGGTVRATQFIATGTPPGSTGYFQYVNNNGGLSASNVWYTDGTNVFSNTLQGLVEINGTTATLTVPGSVVSTGPGGYISYPQVSPSPTGNPASGNDWFFFQPGDLPAYKTSAGNVYNFTANYWNGPIPIYENTANLGIGTSVPIRILDVVSSDTNTTLTTASLPSIGVENLNNATPNNIEELAFSTTDSNGANALAAKISTINTSHTAGSVNGSLNFLTRNNGTTTNDMTIIDGNVGIGTPIPKGSLVVQTGNVGIGTPNPNALFQVKGQGILTVTNQIGIGTAQPGGAFEVEGGNIGVGTHNAPNQLYLTGTAEMQGFKLDGNNAASGYVLTSNGIGIGTWQPAASGSGTVTSVTASSPLASSGGTTPNITVNSSTGTGAIVLQTSPNLTANVGIGSATPGQALDVNGTIRVVGSGTFSGAGTNISGTATNLTSGITNALASATTTVNVSSATAPSSGQVLTATGSTTATWQTSSGSNYWNYSASGNIGISTSNPVGIGTTFIGGAGQGKLVVMGGNVGIGTWIPSALLNVAGQGILTVSNQIGIGTTQPTGALEVEGGNVGIGTWIPSQKLFINGTEQTSNLIDTGLTANTISYANGSQQLTSATISTGLSLTTGTLTSNAEQTISYQPGLLTAVNSNIGVYGKFAKASTVDNIVGSAITFSCTGNPTITMYECGTSTTCVTPITIGTVTVTTVGTAVTGTVSNPAITAGDYVGWAISSGTCISIDIAGTAQIHSN